MKLLFHAVQKRHESILWTKQALCSPPASGSHLKCHLPNKLPYCPRSWVDCFRGFVLTPTLPGNRKQEETWTASLALSVQNAFLSLFVLGWQLAYHRGFIILLIFTVWQMSPGICCQSLETARWQLVSMDEKLRVIVFGVYPSDSWFCREVPSVQCSFSDIGDYVAVLMRVRKEEIIWKQELAVSSLCVGGRVFMDSL